MIKKAHHGSFLAEVKGDTAHSWRMERECEEGSGRERWERESESKDGRGKKQRIRGVSSVRAVFCVRSMPFDILILTSTCNLAAYFSSRCTFSNRTFRRLNYLLSLNVLLLAWDESLF